MILRGGKSGPNYSAEDVKKVSDQLEAVGLPRRVMIDCSHANSGKDPAKQPEVVAEVANQVGGGEQAIFGVMLESFIEEGNQDHTKTRKLEYGLSITDACMSWERTLPTFGVLAEAVRKRRG